MYGSTRTSARQRELVYIPHGGTRLGLGNVDPKSTRLEVIGFFLRTMSATDSSHQMAWSHLPCRSPATYRSSCSFICRLQTKAGIIRARCQICWRCPGKPSFGPVANLKMVRNHLPTGGVLEVDLPPPWFIRSAGTQEYRWCFAAGRRQIVLATNCKGGMLNSWTLCVTMMTIHHREVLVCSLFVRCCMFD